MSACLDDDLPADQIARIEQHLIVCPGCLTTLEQLRSSVHALAALRPEGQRDGVWARLTAALAAPGRGEGGRGVLAYKFLLADRTSPFAGARWPEPGGGWVAAAPPGVPGGRVHLVHACRPSDLAYWINEALWMVELDGHVGNVDGTALTAGRGRLVLAVPGWEEAAADLAADCTARLAALAGSQPAISGETARELGMYADEVRRTWSDFESGVQSETPVAAVAADIAYTLAHAQGVAGWTGESLAAADDTGADNPYDLERVRQGQWLAHRLGLSQLERQAASTGQARRPS